MEINIKRWKEISKGGNKYREVEEINIKRWKEISTVEINIQRWKRKKGSRELLNRSSSY